ncbi:MAG: RES family NAD+ phosphorylase [Pseudomonadota bacterium]
MASSDAAGWRQLVELAPRAVLMGKLLRLVENQTQKVTAGLVDGLDELDVLEQLLEASKPRRRAGTERLDYLLASPWRYPPLPWGSRFGSRFEPGIFYGALDMTALLAEAAYYRLVFIAGMARPFAGRLISQHTRFEALYRTDCGVQLDKSPFDEQHRATLRHPSHYGACQRLGRVLREAGIEAFTYLSARCCPPHLNIALLTPDALHSNRHRRPVHGLCETHLEGVRYRFGEQNYWFDREQFLVDGVLPQPA